MNSSLLPFHATSLPSSIIATQGLIGEPNQGDILCSRDKRSQEQPGNRMYRAIIEAFRFDYANALTKFDKTSVTRDVYDAVRRTGARFLKYNKALQVWEEVSDTNARDKIGHALRFANRDMRRGTAVQCRSGHVTPPLTSKVEQCSTPIMPQLEMVTSTPGQLHFIKPLPQAICLVPDSLKHYREQATDGGTSKVADPLVTFQDPLSCPWPKNQEASDSLFLNTAPDWEEEVARLMTAPLYH